MKLPRRLSVRALMAAVTISAIITNWLRPISRIEAENAAEAKFLSIQGSKRWMGRYQVQAGPAGTLGYDYPRRFADGWTVVLSDPKDGVPLMAMFLSSRGKMRAVDFAPGKFNE